MESPSIACIGIINRSNNPVHISVFPPHEPSRLRFTLFLNSCLDVMLMQEKRVTVDQDLGFLHALDERFAAYGWLTNTDIKFIVIVDTLSDKFNNSKTSLPQEVQKSDLKQVFHALHTAYIKLLQNPFHSPDVDPLAEPHSKPSGSRMERFVAELRRICLSWSPGKSAI